MSTKPYSKLFNVVQNNNSYYVSNNRPKCPEKLRKMCEKKENGMKMRISTEPFYKLFSVTFVIIERIYDDRIPKMFPKNLEKLRKT